MRPIGSRGGVYRAGHPRPRAQLLRDGLQLRFSSRAVDWEGVVRASLPAGHPPPRSSERGRANAVGKVGA